MVYALILPECPVSRWRTEIVGRCYGLRAFDTVQTEKDGCFLFIFSMLLGVLQITNGFANPFLSSFRGVPEYADMFGVNHATPLISCRRCRKHCVFY